ncbi:MAG TPA: YetF domain-containing protein [Gemmatimonadales bacterium]|nr:YetF domain-containing protein [Gemmatimonadales bacterium]
METLFRAALVYLFLTLLFRLAGKRTLSQVTPFDLVLLLIISETVQQAMIAEDNSMTNAALLVLTLIAIDIVLSWLKQRWMWLDRVMDDRPLIIVQDGKPIEDRMKRERVSEGEVMASARHTQGVRRMEDIAYAVLETDGKISIIQKE